MREAVQDDITVKCRIGVDDQEPRDILPAFIDKISQAGCKRISIHARKAWLQGLSPKENRDIPPLDHDLVHEMKQAFPDLHISVNGGITSLDEAVGHLDRGLDGVMIGRAAYHQPWDTLAEADDRIFESPIPLRSPEDIARAMLPYIERHLASGGRLNQITRHMLGLFAGRPGARQWRRTLSEQAHHTGAGPEVIESALSRMAEAA